MERIGIDIGGTGVKGAVVDVDAGTLVSDRLRTDTPVPSTPAAVVEAVAGLVADLNADGPIGMGFPAVVKKGCVFTANNIDPNWIGVDARALFEDRLGASVSMINDADAAGLAEMEFGAALGTQGLVIVLTFGTGIGSAFFHDGRLIPNVELGQIEFGGASPAESRYSAKSRTDEDLEWPVWADRAREYIVHVNNVFSPELIVFGGGAAKRWELFSDRFGSDLPLVPATLRNDAGIVGAATLVRG